MEVLFARGGRFQWEAQILEITSEGQFVSLALAADQLQTMASSLLCRLPYEVESINISNHHLAKGMNLYVNVFNAPFSEKISSRGIQTMEDIFRSLACHDGLSEHCHVLRAIDEIKRRVNESNELFAKKKELSLREYEMFIFRNGKGWIKLKGGRVKKSAYGLWVEKEEETELVAADSCQMLIDKKI